LAKIAGMAVTTVFGERLWIQAADQGTSNAWGRWSIFTIDIRNAPAGQNSVDPTLLLLPILSSRQAGPTQQEVLLVRDEVADMAWGVEKTVALASGISRPGSEVAKQTFNYLQSLIPGGSTSLLRQGLDATSAQTYFLHEEEVPRAGARLTEYYSRSRWSNGQVHTWLRAHRSKWAGVRHRADWRLIAWSIRTAARPSVAA